MTILVRALEHDVEIDAFCALSATAFAGFYRSHCTPEPDGSLANGWRRYNEDDPGFEASRLRGAFLDHTLVGGYIHDERWLCLEDARLRTGYIGTVLTDPAYRGLGVGTALMLDSIEFARTRGQALLILRGIPDFYHRFGFTDVMEVTEHAVESERVLGLPHDGMHVRPATLDDAPALLELYQRHYYPFAGAYSRTLAQQQHFIRQRSNPPLLAVDDAGRARGYALLSCGADRSLAVEAAADNWAAALALLKCHVRASAGSAEVRWPLPFGSSTYHHLADNLPLVSRTSSRPNAGWMARPGHVGELFSGMLSLWRQRWRRAGGDWSGVFNLEVDGERCCLQLTPGELRRLDTSPDAAAVVRVTPGVLAQLVFGYRPAFWAAKRGDQLIPEKLVPVIAALLPVTPAWYAGSNRC